VCCYQYSKEIVHPLWPKKLLEHAVKVTDGVSEKSRSRGNTAWMQITDAIFVVRQMQEKYGLKAGSTMDFRNLLTQHLSYSLVKVQQYHNYLVNTFIHYLEGEIFSPAATRLAPCTVGV